MRAISRTGRVLFVAIDRRAPALPPGLGGRFVVDPALAAAIGPSGTGASEVEAESLPVASPDALLARCFGGEDVVRLLAAPFDDEALREIAAVTEAPVASVIVPSTERSGLHGIRVLVTRARAQSEGVARALRRRGAIPISAPTIVIDPPDDPGPLARAVAALSDYALVAFTSANGVEATFAALEAAALDARAFGVARVAAIGPGTAAALAGRGIRADVVAPEHRGEALAEAIAAAVPAASRILIPRAAVARDALPDALAAAGHRVDVVEAYRTRRPALPRSSVPTFDAITFTSSSTVENFVASVGDPMPLLSNAVVASIGPITSATCARLGVRVDVEASPYTIPALVDALERHLRLASSTASR